MKVIIAPDSYKGSMTSIEAADSVERGIRKVFNDAQIIKLPIADGGEGTVQALVECTKGKIITSKVMDPLNREIEAAFGILGDNKTAVVEVAAASGITLLKPEERNPMRASTYGTGQLIKQALDMNCKSFILGIGGSATNDGGAGMAVALGAKLLDKKGAEIGFGGGCLGNLHNIDISGLDKRISKCEIVVACDVDNPLCGINGAANIYARQKGADDEMIKLLDSNLEHYAAVIKEQLGSDIMHIPGAGAAGGLGGGLVAFLNGSLRRGIDIILNTIGFEEQLRDSDIVITGEGMTDSQTLFGKAPFGVAKMAQKHGVPVVVISGSVGEGVEKLYDCGIYSIFSIIDRPMNINEAMKNGSELLEKAAERIFRVININK